MPKFLIFNNQSNLLSSKFSKLLYTRGVKQVKKDIFKHFIGLLPSQERFFELNRNTLFKVGYVIVKLHK